MNARWNCVASNLLIWIVVPSDTEQRLYVVPDSSSVVARIDVVHVAHETVGQIPHALELRVDQIREVLVEICQGAVGVIPGEVLKLFIMIE